MGGSSHQTQSTNSTTTGSSSTQPWSVQTPYLTQGFQGAQNALDMTQSALQNPNYAAPTAFTAGLTPQQMATFTGMSGYNSVAPYLAAGYGTGALGTAQGLQNNAVSGLSMYNPFASNNVNRDVIAGNAYAAGANIPGQVQAAMLPAMQEARDVINPGIAQNAARSGGGADNSRALDQQGIVARGLAEQSAGLGAQLQANYYNTGAGLAANAGAQNNQAQLASLLGQGNLGNTTAGIGLGALNQSIGNQGQVYGIQAQGGQGLQQGNQANLTNQLQGFNFGQSAPFLALQNYWNQIGSNNWGNQTTGTSTTQGTGQTTYTPSLANQIGGWFGAGSSLLGAFA